MDHCYSIFDPFKITFCGFSWNCHWRRFSSVFIPLEIFLDISCQFTVLFQVFLSGLWWTRYICWLSSVWISYKWNCDIILRLWICRMPEVLECMVNFTWAVLLILTDIWLGEWVWDSVSLFLLSGIIWIGHSRTSLKSKQWCLLQF